MKQNILAGLSAALALLPSTSAHYIFQQLTHGSTKYPLWQYIRQHSNGNTPVTALSSKDLRCNLGASGANTQTLQVKAGDSLTFHTDVKVYHQGPTSMYLSKAPGAASDYDGSGDWFKFYDWGPTAYANGGTWKLDTSYTFNIPKCIPNGDYLLRIQQLGIHNPYPSAPQFYLSCAQITVTGGGNASPGPVAKIPGVFKETDSGYTVNIYNPSFSSYTVPGPAVWSQPGTCGASPDPEPQPQPTTKPPGTTLTTTTRAPQPTCTVSQWGQCGGESWKGCTTCAGSFKCVKGNDFYHQCQ